MATIKLSQLGALTTADANDVILITDTDAAASKKITVANLINTPISTAIANLVDSAPATLDTLNELAAALGDDANFATTVTTSIGTKWTQDNTKISNWDTAYGWGDHSTEGYLTSYTETDPVVGAVTGIVKADGAGNISAAVAGTDYVATETDPVVGAITGIVKADGAGNISAAVAGTDYLASYTETDPVVGAVTGIVKADGAGNISAAVAGTDYLASYTETDPVVGAVTGIVKADGAGNISAAVAGTDYLTTVQDGNIDSETATDGYVLTADGLGGAAWEAAAAGYADSDVDTHLNTSSATTGQVLSWDGSDYDWTNIVTFGNWTITESSGVLYFATGGTNKMKLDASGNLTVVGDVTAYGTM